MQDSGEIHGNIGVIFHHVHVISNKDKKNSLVVLILCMLGNSCFFCHLLTFSQNLLFSKHSGGIQKYNTAYSLAA